MYFRKKPVKYQRFFGYNFIVFYPLKILYMYISKDDLQKAFTYTCICNMHCMASKKCKGN